MKPTLIARWAWFITIPPRNAAPSGALPRWHICPIVLLLCLAAGPAPAGADDRGTTTRVSDFYNVVAPAGADPWVMKHSDGWYYGTWTTNVDVTLVRSPTISAFGGGERKVVYTPPAGVKNLWAPEIHRIDGRWYIYVAADDGNNTNHRMFVLENSSANPFHGRFQLKGKVFDRTADRWAIDGTVLRVRDRLYFVWSGWEGSEDVAQNLYIAPLQNPWTLGGRRVIISRPSLPWEARGGPPAVNEGPQVLVKGEFLHIVYSAAGSWSDHYCLGLLSARIDSDLLAASSWTKRPLPVFESAPGVPGPGHCSFVSSPDGRDEWIIYHAARYRGARWTRLLRAQPFGWTDDGTPSFGRPAPPNQPIRLPGGEPARLRLEAEDAILGGAARVFPDPSASHGARVGHLDAPDDSVTFKVPGERAGKFLLVIRYSSPASGNAVASHRCNVNDRELPPIRYEKSGPENWSNAFVPVMLDAGESRVRLSAGAGRAEIDCIDLLRGSSPSAGGDDQ
jgi:GH43 family beta-xylosidase